MSDNVSWSGFLFSFALYITASVVQGSPNDPDRKSYIVYMGDVPDESINAVDQHQSLLVNAIGDAYTARASIIHNYRRSFNGFAAKLLPHEVDILKEDLRVISVFPNKIRHLHTTRSWDFLGMPLSVQNGNMEMQRDMIIGILDTGIYVGAPSFHDQGYGPAPERWKGKCTTGMNFTGCNNKVIGAKYFNLDHIAQFTDLSPNDDDGHGTHTASTVAGVPVQNASFYGIADGTARGGVPSARIAMYKVCWMSGCNDIDILAAFDEAIADGVDLISISIGGPSRSFFDDPIAIGSFHAMRAGILTACSAGNHGPETYTVQNVAPWILTVGASSIDRQFMATARFGNGERSVGIAINAFSSGKQMFPLTSGTLAANLSTPYYGNASICQHGTLSEAEVRGKVVFCHEMNGQEYLIQELGGVGIITASDLHLDLPMTTLIPGTVVSVKDGLKIEQYINSTNKPQVSISRTRNFKMDAPFVTSFSARGPQLISPNILKPDITAPGLGILAAFSKIPSVTGAPTDPRHETFNILSGTSMACPHAAAAAAYVKSVHPDWSPTTIRSALMTTATPMKIRDTLEELSSGSGQINPGQAADPGLVYDFGMKAYIRFLCYEGYNDTMIGLLMGGRNKFSCSSMKPARGFDGINYPSMHMQLKDTNEVKGTFFRTATNVGSGKSVYNVTVTAPEGISIKVVPGTLTFDKPGQKQSYKVFIEGINTQTITTILSGSITWSDSKHVVRSPILIYIARYTMGTGHS